MLILLLQLIILSLLYYHHYSCSCISQSPNNLSHIFFSTWISFIFLILFIVTFLMLWTFIFVTHQTFFHNYLTLSILVIIFSTPDKHKLLLKSTLHKFLFLYFPHIITQFPCLLSLILVCQHCTGFTWLSSPSAGASWLKSNST